MEVAEDSHWSNKGLEAISVQLGLIDAVWEGSEWEGVPGSHKAQEMGFDAVDIALDPLDLDDTELARFLTSTRDLALPKISVICVGLGIADYNRSVARFHTERAIRHVDFAAQLGAKNVLLVIGDYPWRGEVIPQSQQWRWAVDNVREVAIRAQATGLEIALELEPFEYAIVNSIDLMVRFLDEVDVPAMKANADLAHLWALQIPARELSKLADRIAHAHIADTDGVVYRCLPPGRGSAPLLGYVEALAEAGFDGVVSLELEPPPAPEDVVAWVAEGYEQTAKLFDAAGIKRTQRVA